MTILEAKLTTLPNGLRVVTKSTPSFESVVLGYWIEAGGIYEDESNCGISHFLEHMAFKGTNKRTARQIAEEIEAVGGYLNAYTSKEITAYHAKILKNDFGMAVDIVSDIVHDPTFLLQEIERERGVILQEISQTNDSPDDIIFDHFQNVAFPNQSMGRSILGPVDVVSKINADDLISYRNKHYNANKMIFSAVGNIDHDEVVDSCMKFFEKFNDQPVAGVNNAVYNYVGGSYADERDIEQSHVIIGFNGVSNVCDDYYTQAILSSILGGGMSSRLFQEVREKRGLVYSIYAFSSSYSKNGLFGVYAATSSDKLYELTDITINELIKIKDHISEKEFVRTKAQFKASLLMANESNAVLCEQIANQSIIFGHPIDNQAIVAKIEAVTMDDIKRLVDKILSSNVSAVTIGKCSCDAVLKALSDNKIK